jgi:hypothetical protein
MATSGKTILHDPELQDVSIAIVSSLDEKR